MRLGRKTALVMVVAVLVPWKSGQDSDVSHDAEGPKCIPMADSLNVRSSQGGSVAATIAGSDTQYGTISADDGPKAAGCFPYPRAALSAHSRTIYLCSAGETCEIQIDDEFHEVFIPQPKVGLQVQFLEAVERALLRRTNGELHHYSRHIRSRFPIWNRFSIGTWRLLDTSESASWTTAIWA